MMSFLFFILFSFFFKFNFMSFVIQVITTLLSSSVSAALAIAHVGKKGNSHAGWLPICGQVHKFCNQVTAALIAAFIAAIIYLVLLLYTLHCLYVVLSSSLNLRQFSFCGFCNSFQYMFNLSFLLFSLPLPPRSFDSECTMLIIFIY